MINFGRRLNAALSLFAAAAAILDSMIYGRGCLLVRTLQLAGSFFDSSLRWRHPPAPPSGGATLRSQWKWPTDAGDATHRRQQQPLSTIIDSDVAWRGPPLGGGRKEGAASLLLISSLNGPPHQNHKESQRIRRESFKNDPNSWKILQNPQILGKYQRFLYKKWKERWRILQESLE